MKDRYDSVEDVDLLTQQTQVALSIPLTYLSTKSPDLVTLPQDAVDVEHLLIAFERSTHGQRSSVRNGLKQHEFPRRSAVIRPGAHHLLRDSPLDRYANKEKAPVTNRNQVNSRKMRTS